MKSAEGARGKRRGRKRGPPGVQEGSAGALKCAGGAGDNKIREFTLYQQNVDNIISWPTLHFFSII